MVWIIVDAKYSTENICKKGAKGTTNNRPNRTNKGIDPFRRIHLCKAPKGTSLLLESKFFESVIGEWGIKGETKIRGRKVR
jgi:hypothetical protein